MRLDTDWGNQGAGTRLWREIKRPGEPSQELGERADGTAETENSATEEWARSEAWQPSPVGFHGKQMLTGSSTDGPRARGSLLTPGPARPPRQPACAWRSKPGPKRQVNDSPTPVGLHSLSSNSSTPA